MDALDVLAVKACNHVSRLYACLLCRTAGFDRGDQRSLAAGYSKRLGNRRGDLLETHPDETALDPASADQLVDDVPGGAGWYRKANPYAATCGRYDGRIDPDHFAARIEQRAAGIAAID